MTLYQKLSNKLRRLSIFDFILIKWVYLTLGILLASTYPPLYYLSIWSYLILSLIAATPLLMLTFSFNGNLFEKAKQYLANNTPSNQVLTLISCASIGIALAIFLPILTQLRWYLYLIIMLLLALKPLLKVLPKP